MVPEKPGKARVAIVLINYNSWQHTLECLESLKQSSFKDYQIYVVDNGSKDDSIARLKASDHAFVLMEAGDNLGFPAANNVAMEPAVASGCDYVWMLNNDTVITRDALEELVRLADEHPHYLFLGSWVGYYDAPNVLWYGGGIYNWKTGMARHQHYQTDSSGLAEPPVKETAWITGCSVLIRRGYFEQYGYMDPDFFIYHEDLEMQLRPNPKAPAAFIINRCLVLHKVGMSTGTEVSMVGRFFRSRSFLILARKYGFTLRWLPRWISKFLLQPLTIGKPGLIRAAIVGARAMDMPFLDAGRFGYSKFKRS